MISPASASFTLMRDTSANCVLNWAVKLPGICCTRMTAPGKSLGKLGINFISVAGPPVEDANTMMGNLPALLAAAFTVARTSCKPLSPFFEAGSTRGDDEATSCCNLDRVAVHHADLGGYLELAAQFFFDRAHVQINAAGRLGHKINRAQFQRFQCDVRTFARLRAHNQDRPGIAGHDDLSGLKTIHVRHVDVHTDDVRLKRLGLSDCVTPVARLAAHFQLWIRRNNALQHFAHERRVVHNQHPCFLTNERHLLRKLSFYPAAAFSIVCPDGDPINLDTAAMNWSSCTGLVRKAIAPSFIARSRCLAPARDVTTITGILRVCAS